MKNEAVQNYKKFHGRPPTRFGGVNFTMPRALTYLGEAFAIDYVSAKRLNGSHRPRLFRHKMGKGVKIYLHPDRRWILVGGGNFRVTDWMRG